MKKEIKCKSPNCPEVLTGETHFEDSDGAMIFPVMFFPTLKSVLDYYENLVGDDYEHNTGVNPKEAFYKTKCNISHLSIDDLEVDKKSHTFGDVECWTDV